MRFFKLANCIFDYPLSPKGFIVYTYLLGHSNVLHTVVKGYKEIAVACHMDAKTACSAIEELVSQGLVIKESRFNFLGRARNKYTVKKLTGGWFKVEYKLFRNRIKSTDFMVYCYIKRCMDNKVEEAFPSLSAIAQSTGISRSRVVQAVQYLRDHTYLIRIKRRYKQTQAFRQNQYLKFRLKPLQPKALQKLGRARRPKRALPNIKCLPKWLQFLINIIGRMIDKVKLIFFNRGSPDFP
jgi:hypothetical protein